MFLTSGNADQIYHLSISFCLWFGDDTQNSYVNLQTGALSHGHRPDHRTTAELPLNMTCVSENQWLLDSSRTSVLRSVQINIRW